MYGLAMRSGQCFKSSSLVGRLRRRSLRLLRLTIRSALGAVVSLDFRAALAQIERVGIRRRCRQRTSAATAASYGRPLSTVLATCAFRPEAVVHGRQPGGPSTAHRMRAFLLARATTALRHPTRPLSFASHWLMQSLFLPAMIKADFAPWISSALREPSPRLVMRPKLALPPVAFWLDTRPSQA